MKYAKSASLFDAAKKMFPGGVHSPVRAFKAVDGPPLFIKNAKGSKMVDADGNKFIDFCCSWGPLILGHADDDIVKAIQSQAEKGISYGTPSELGNQLGQLILSNHRYIEKIRFVSSGTEAVMSAVRLARGVTGRNKIIKFDGCYHGHLDSLLVKAGSGLATFGTSSSAGVPESFVRETLVLPLADLNIVEDAFKKHEGEIAAIIIEPIPANNGLLLQDKSYLQGLRDLCTQHGALLIFDEVISGFRVGFEGAAGWYEIKPDICTFGKIIGGGMPVGAYAGSEAIMSHVSPEGDVYQAGTLSANPMAMVAGYETLKRLHQVDFYEKLNKKGLALANQIEDVLRPKGFSVQNIGSIFWIKFSSEQIKRADQIDAASSELFRKLYAHLLDHGIYLGPSAYEVGFLSSAHSDQDIAVLVSALDSFD